MKLYSNNEQTVYWAGEMPLTSFFLLETREPGVASSFVETTFSQKN